MRIALPLLCLVVGAVPLFAQEFEPPESEESVRPTGLRLGLYGFAARAGVDFTDGAQVVLGVALDLGDIFSDRVRLRPSSEIAFGNDTYTYLASVEAIYRFTPDTERAIPYVGFGFGIWGEQRCRVGCPDVWLQFALGFELRLRGQMNWMLEYHGEDALRRHRFLIGLATRRN